MEDRRVEAAHRRERGVGVQRVAITRQPVHERLVGRRLVGDGVIGGALGRHVHRAAGATIAAPSPFTADERRHPRRHHRLPRLRVDRLRLAHDERGLALVVDAGDLARGADRSLGRDRLVQLDRLLPVHEHRRVERADLAERSAAHADDHGEGREHLLRHARGVLGRERELVDAGTRRPRRRAGSPSRSTRSRRARTRFRRRRG